MLRLTINPNRLIFLKRSLTSTNNSFSQTPVQTSTKTTLQYYAKTGGSCLAKSGIALWLVFFPATQLFSYCGGASVLTNSLLKYDLTKSVVEKSRKLGRENVPSFLGERFIEVFITGFSLYFLLKPVRYSLWFYLTKNCINNKQTAAMLASRKELMKKSQQRFKVGYGYFKRKNSKITFKSKTKSKTSIENEKMPQKRISSNEKS